MLAIVPTRLAEMQQRRPHVQNDLTQRTTETLSPTTHTLIEVCEPFLPLIPLTSSRCYDSESGVHLQVSPLTDAVCNNVSEECLATFPPQS